MSNENNNLSEGTKRGNSTVWIIILAVVLIVVCSCCLLFLLVGWFLGDFVVEWFRSGLIFSRLFFV